MRHRVSATRGPAERCAELVSSGEIAFVEMEYPTKWISRATSEITFAAGGHGVDGVVGDRRRSAQIVCLHAPLRAQSILMEKAAHGRRLIEAGYPESHGWHVQRWHKLQLAGRIDGEWDANSVSCGRLGKAGAHAVVLDDRLYRAVRPWVRGFAEQGNQP